MKKQKKFYETPEFNKEQAKWYALLKQDGFKDTETIRDIKNNNINQQVVTVNDEWMVYHDKCRAYLASGKVTNALDLFILEKHCDGISNRDITGLLNKNGLKIVSRMTINRRLTEMLNDAQIEPIQFKL